MSLVRFRCLLAGAVLLFSIAGPGLTQETVPEEARQAETEQEEAAPEDTPRSPEQLDSRTVSGIPLNKRDFSQLLLLAAGAMTDTNGTANFTQQFTINGQRGTATIFAMDGIFTSDPEMGGATFSNFNVDAIAEVRSSSGVMPPEIGQGSAGLTNVITKSGTNEVHGSFFWFVRNAALDARNYFDRQSVANPNRLPPFTRNEFGLTNGGPVVLPKLYDGRNRTFYFAQHQGFRQVLGTTQVLSVPTQDERRGVNTTAFPGDTLFVPVNPEIANVLDAYPMPNDSQGAYGDRTYATSSKVKTVSDQFSVRLDHQFSSAHRLFFRFNLNNVDGPETNPNQTAIDPSFVVSFLDRQRNAGLKHTWTPSANFILETSIGYLRSTPNFPTFNKTQPALRFIDGIYEPFNEPAGSVMGSYGNLWQFRQDFSRVSGNHSMKWGWELRLNRDSTVWGSNPNGSYSFGGGVAPSPVHISSASGLNDIAPGEPLPDALSAFLTGSPFSFDNAQAPELFAQGDRMGLSAIHRDAFNLYWQDTWRPSGRVSVTYGLRYEINSQIREHQLRTSGLRFSGPVFSRGPNGEPPDVEFLVNPQPTYNLTWKGFAPRLAFDWRLGPNTVFRAGAAINNLVTNLWQENMLTGGTPYSVASHLASAPGAPLEFSNSVIQLPLPDFYTPGGDLIFESGRTTDVPGNTEMDVDRFIQERAGLSPDGKVRPMSAGGIAEIFTSGYVPTVTASLEHTFQDVAVSAAYVATSGVRLPAICYPNGYTGASPEYANYTRYDEAGDVVGGYGLIYLMNNHSHSSFHSLQVSASKQSARLGLSFQASYAYGKSLDDTSAVLGGFITASSGALVQTSAQNPRNLKAEKGPSTFDVSHVFNLSAFQDLPFQKIRGLRSAPRALTTGWQLMAVTTMMTGMPFTVYSGIQQTAAGSNSADRPDQTGTPELSTSRKIREDYFGAGANNSAYFHIPTGVEGGTGPNQGRFGTLGRNTFRGPGLHNFDFALIKDTLIGRRGAAELFTLQFRAEFFNAFNLVNFGLPSNIVLGSGFGMINRTATPSRQVQFSLKLFY